MPPSLILLDMVMQATPFAADRGSTCSDASASWVCGPVLMMSGNYESRKEAYAPMEGAFGYVHKPFDVRALDRLVAKDIATHG